jgi:signal peptidase II
MTTLPRSAGITAIAVILADALTKAIARVALPLCEARTCRELTVIGPFHLVRVRNAGSALGFLPGLWLWALVAAAGVCLVPILARRSADPTMVLGASLLAAGGLGNLLDRVFAGAVTDFIHAGVPVVFNVADVALVIGALWMSRALASTPAPARAPAN